MKAEKLLEDLKPLMHLGPEYTMTLLPKVVNLLEELDSALTDNSEYIGILDDSNQEYQLLSEQYQREKKKRRELEEVLPDRS